MYSKKGKQIHMAKQPTQMERKTEVERCSTTRVLKKRHGVRLITAAFFDKLGMIAS